MPNTTASAAAGGAMPARRQILTALAGAPVLAIPALATPAAAATIGADPDAPIMVLIARLADARERVKPVIDRLGVVEEAFRARGLPAEPQRHEVPSPEREAARESFRAAAEAYCALPDPSIDEERYRREMRSWRRRVRYWKRKTGLAEAEAAEMRVLEELGELERELMDRPAMTLAGLRAKACAWDGDPDAAEAIVHELRGLAAPPAWGSSAWGFGCGPEFGCSRVMQ